MLIQDLYPIILEFTTNSITVLSLVDKYFSIHTKRSRFVSLDTRDYKLITDYHIYINYMNHIN